MNLIKGRWLARADKALQAGDIEAAERIVQKRLERRADDAEALHLLGRIRFFMERYEAAQALYERLLKMDAADETARENLRQTHLRQAFQAREAGGIEAAAAAYRAALSINPNDAFTYYNLGCALMDGGEDSQRADEAEAAWRRAVELSPGYVDAHFDLAQLYFAGGRFEAARPHFEAAAKARPDWPAPLHWLAVIDVKAGDLEAGLKRLQSAAQLNAGWARTAAEDPHLKPLRGNAAFEELIQQAVGPGPLDVLTREDLLRDTELFEDMDDAEE